ncbi:MAG TPA: hypothetical protein VHB20_10075 [Verrucomicrobiae bacterium]|jgi:hypothetical protein|nr:hypothetical protein [Verrucomicrobiae bacterium]
MRILIQDPDSKRFFDGSQWGSDANSAMEFESVYSAEQFCHEQTIEKALIVVKFNDAAAQDIKYAVGPANALLTSKPPTTRLYRH